MRLRFAPSPTGHLHIGGARTALFNFLLARRHGGVFVLRIEDTDRARSRPEYEEEILRDLRWLSLDWDEGPGVGGSRGPYHQMQRLDHYGPYIDQLLAEGKAYRCNCSAERIQQGREALQAAGRKPMYDRHCRDLDLGPDCGEHVVRLKVPLEGSTAFDDHVRGRVEIDNAEIDDFVIRRSNGLPPYNFVVVVDDHEMGITHVVRGEDHINNTPKQVLIYRALGWEPPEFAHAPLILGPDGSRLSKRHGAVSVGAYREEGYLPEALVNYLVRLGWSHGDDEVFSLDELISVFSLDGITKAGGRWDVDKLRWLNQVWMKRLDPADLAERARPFLVAAGADPALIDDRLVPAVLTVRERARTLVELGEQARFYFVPDDALDWDEQAVKKHIKASTRPILDGLLAVLEGVEDWSQEGLEAAVKPWVEAEGIKLGKVAQPVRVSLTGKGVGPGLWEMLAAIGREVALRRIRAGRDKAAAREAAAGR
ncbi:MAG: glutamate--tRNA ligase [Deltaproteobacteria bacterium]|nr:MAG: glutamate--tRNA ligase [Deltaproteobacteria bacterium]